MANSPIPLALNAQHLQKTYGKTHAVQDVSLSMKPGEVLAFLGPNGAGKTTTIKMIAGLIQPDEGTVEIMGRNPHQEARSLQSVGAVLEGNRNLYWRLTPLENLEYFGVLRGLSARTARRAGQDLLERFHLTDKKRTPVKSLSRGMQQKVAIAVALVHQPKLLLLDEPTLGLDVEASETVKGLVKTIAEKGCAVLLTTHQLNVAEELADRVAIIQQGRIIAEEATQTLIQKFSGSSYVIELDDEVDEKRQEAIAPLGAIVQANKVFYTGEAEGLYVILESLRPLPFIQIKQDQADLTAVFLKLVQGSENGG